MSYRLNRIPYTASETAHTWNVLPACCMLPMLPEDGKSNIEESNIEEGTWEKKHWKSSVKRGMISEREFVYVYVVWCFVFIGKKCLT